MRFKITLSNTLSEMCPWSLENLLRCQDVWVRFRWWNSHDLSPIGWNLLEPWRSKQRRAVCMHLSAGENWCKQPRKSSSFYWYVLFVLISIQMWCHELLFENKNLNSTSSSQGYFPNPNPNDLSDEMHRFFCNTEKRPVNSYWSTDLVRPLWLVVTTGSH